MYKSPINKIYGDVETQIIKNEEEMIIKAIRKVKINVDKKELIKALNYDRNQYTRGYKDGRTDALEEVKAEIIQMSEIVKSSDEWLEGLYYAISIIDKCMEESEVI